MSKQFLNSIYKRPVYGYNDKGKRVLQESDILYTIIKDTDTGKTTLNIEEQPKISFYVAKQHQPFHAISIPKEDVTEIVCKYDGRDLELAKAANMVDQFWDALRNGNKGMFMRDILKHPDLFMADVDIEDYRKTMFMVEHGANYGKYRKGFSDIEVDISNYKGFPDEDIAPVPINTINHIDGATKTIYSVILRDPTNPGVAWLENNIEKFWKHQMLRELKEEDYDFKYKFFFVDSEAEVIDTYFNNIHITEPDFVAFWNQHFDITTIINRMKKLKMNIPDVMCPDYIPSDLKYVKWNRENVKPSFGSKGGDSEKSSAHPSRAWHWLEVAGKTQWYDQMSLYSNLRKRFTLPSYKLDDIGKNEVKVQKVNFRDHGYTMKSVIHKDFALYMRYSIKDVYVQYKIEQKVEDLDKYILFSGNTRLSKGTKISYVIKNVMMKSFLEQGLIIGNTVLYDVRDFTPGAIVSDPNLMRKKGMMINGYETNIFKNVIDFDAASLYPNLMISFNISKSTLFGRIFRIFRKTKDEELNISCTGAEFNSALQTIDVSVFDMCKKVFGLPSIEDLIDEIEKGIDLKLLDK